MTAETRQDDNNDISIKEPYLDLAKKIAHRLSVQSFLNTALFIIALLYTLNFTRDFLLPIFISLLLYFLFYPIVRFISNYHIPPQISACVIILLLFIVIVYGFYSLSYQARDWLEKSPEIFNIAGQKLSNLLRFMQQPMVILSKIKNQLNDMMSLTSPRNIEQVNVTQSYIISFLFTNTWQFFIEFFMTFVILFFLLVSEDYYLKKIVKFLANMKQKKEAVNIAHQTERQLWNYLFARTIINIGVAISVSILMYILDMPNPVLWGVVAGTLEFIPYLGALASIIIVGMVAIVSFENFWHIISVPVSLFIVLSLEGSFIAPYIFGRNMRLNTITVVLSVFFLGWIWGIMGALIAVPVLMSVKIFIDNIYPSSAINEFMSE